MIDNRARDKARITIWYDCGWMAEFEAGASFVGPVGGDTPEDALHELIKHVIPLWWQR